VPNPSVVLSASPLSSAPDEPPAVESRPLESVSSAPSREVVSEAPEVVVVPLAADSVPSSPAQAAERPMTKLNVKLERVLGTLES